MDEQGQERTEKTLAHVDGSACLVEQRATASAAGSGVSNLKAWFVVTPEYGEVVPILDYGQGPMEYGADVIEVEAATKRDAIIAGVALMRSRPGQFHYFRDHCEGNPFAGVTAWSADDEGREA